MRDCILYSIQAVEDKYMESDDMKSWKTILSHLDRLFIVTFAMELLLKMTAYGPMRYFTNTWCWLDFVIVLVRNYIPYQQLIIPTSFHCSSM